MEKVNREVARRSNRRALISMAFVVVIACIFLPLCILTRDFVYVIAMGIGFGIVMLWQIVSDHRDARRNS